MTDTYSEIPLFEEYPALGQKLHRMPLGDFPTPVQEFPTMASRIGVNRLFVKRDDLTHTAYGGNKVRKLEFLFAEAQRFGAKKVLTFGGIGSNHFLATTVHASRLGMRSIGVLVAQPVTSTVRRNLLSDLHYGPELHLAGGYQDAAIVALRQIIRHTVLDGRPPFVIPTGGSSVSGTIGYVNAAFELKRQVDAGELPEPDMIFVAAGTCGTSSGLIAGCRAAGLKSKVVAVQVTDPVAANPLLLSSLATRVSLRLFAADQKFPLQVFTPFDVTLDTDYFGGEYGCITPEGIEAIRTAEECSCVHLEGVYTGKAFAAIIGAARKTDLASKNILYWHTYNSADISHIAVQHDYSELPPEFHQFFEEPVAADV